MVNTFIYYYLTSYTKDMNKLFLMLFFLLLPDILLAQTTDDSIDIVYLKNKEIYKGTIVKNDLGVVSISVIKKGKPEVLKFQYYEIEKIEQIRQKPSDEGSDIPIDIDTEHKKSFTQEQLGAIKPFTEEKINYVEDIKKNQQHINQPIGEVYNMPLTTMTRTGKVEEQDLLAPVPDKRALREWTREIRGFRGFFELSYNLGIDKIRNNTFDITKSVGFQFNPIVYLGVGTSYKISMNKESSLPVFINPRLNMTDNEDINPFWDVKIGYSIVQTTGAYSSTSLGASFVMGKKDQFAFNLGLTYSYLNANFYRNNADLSPRIKITENYHQIGLTLGFEY